MAEIENVKIKNSGVELIKLELNNEGEYIMISPDNTAMFDQFVAGIRHIAEMADEMPGKLDGIKKQYEGKTDLQSRMDGVVAVSRVNVSFSEEAVAIIDGIFGEDTIKKYFRDAYREIPDFLPSSDCIIDFFEQITPPMEKIFNRRLDAHGKLRRERMAKYAPLDHRKPAAKK